MANHSKRGSIRQIVFKTIKSYGRKAGELGIKVRSLVFGFRQRSTLHTDRNAFSVKLLLDHKLVQRQRAFQQAGGARSGIAQHALNKVKRHRR